jgi:hypothetical protein
VVPFLYGGNFVRQVAINPGRYKEIERTRHQGSSGTCLVVETKRLGGRDTKDQVVLG